MGYSLAELASYDNSGHKPVVRAVHWQVLDPKGAPVMFQELTVTFADRAVADHVVALLNFALEVLMPAATDPTIANGPAYAVRDGVISFGPFNSPR